MSDLKILIGADIKQAEAALNNIQKDLSQTAKIANTSGAAISTSSQKAATAISKIAPVTGQANTALINFGRVVQDAPYGIIGIANNIDPLIASFQRLKTETGSTGKAFKALGAGLLGPAGIAIGVSAVTSLLVSFGSTLFKNSSDAREAEEAVRGYESALELLRDTVKGLKSELDFGSDLADINNQINQTTDLEGLRQQSVAQREFTQQLRDQQDELKRQMESVVSDEKLTADKRVEIQEKQNSELRDLQRQETDSLNKQRIIYRKIQFSKVKDDIEANKKSKDELNRLIEERLKILRDFQFKFSREKIPFPKIDFSALPKYLEQGNDVLRDNLSDALKFGIEKRDIRIEAALKPAFVFPEDDVVSSFREAQEKLQRFIPKIASTLQPLSTAALKIKADIDFDRKVIADRIKAMNETISGLATDGLAGIAETIGSTIATGDIQNGFKAFAGIIASGIVAIGKQMILLSPVIAALKTALKTLNPAVLLPAGIALVAIGSALRATIGKGITGFAEGGLVFGPVNALIGEGRGTSRNNPEVIAPLDKLRNMIGGIGSSNVTVDGEFRISGNDLVLLLARANKSQRRSS